jgi:uncharacterized iron-regulated protein
MPDELCGFDYCFFLCGLILIITFKSIKMKFTAVLFFIVLSLQSFSQDKPAYKIYTEEGKKADYRELLKEVMKADVVFFGESHDNPIAHWLELEITKELFTEKAKNLVLAAEMFETDNQLLIDEYLTGIIKEPSFETEVRLWKNYGTDYKPLMTFAKKNGLKFVASNIPRRYASVVSSGGFEALEKLSPEALKYIVPLPVEYDSTLACYKVCFQWEVKSAEACRKKSVQICQKLRQSKMLPWLIRLSATGKRGRWLYITMAVIIPTDIWELSGI